MIPTWAKDMFWHVVEDCLIEIHGWPPDKARDRAGELRADLGSPPFGLSPDMVYHAEPFDVALDLTGIEAGPEERNEALARHWDQYQAIRNRHRW